ncbi:MAG: DJ-1/PfpI family protein [Caldilineaceae bacterium]
MSDVEKQHIMQALHFELGKVMVVEVRQRMVDLLANIDTDLAANVGSYLGLTPQAGQPNPNAGTAKGLSQLEYVPGTPMGRKVAILAADGVTGAEVTQMQSALQDAGVTVEIVAPHLGSVQSADGEAIPVNQSLLTTASVLYDAVYVPGGTDSVNALQGSGDALRFIQEAFKHYKPLAAGSEGADFFQAAGITGEAGVVTGEDDGIADAFLEAIGQHRFWDRQVPV